MRNYFFIFAKLSIMFFLFFISKSYTEGQEYATDRLFMKGIKKTKCKIITEKKIKRIKNNRLMTLEHEALLNQNIWSKLKLKLPLSSGEKSRLENLRKKGINSNKLSAKEIWALNASKFKEMRLKCK